MVERAIQDGFVDCPKFGIIDEVRCLPSCACLEVKDEHRVTCHFGEEWPPAPADQEAQAPAEEA